MRQDPKLQNRDDRDLSRDEIIRKYDLSDLEDFLINDIIGLLKAEDDFEYGCYWGEVYGSINTSNISYERAEELRNIFLRGDHEK